MKNSIFLVVIFSIAMGFMEGAVVVYLREIYYPNGFGFPLAVISNKIAFTELLRELATVIMLSAIGILSGKTKCSSFAYFMLSFAVWDLVYYLALKFILNWPESLFTWDVLFLIPFPWLGPVLAPVLISIAMIILTFVILKKEHDGFSQRFPLNSIFFFIVGSLIILWTFMKDYIQLIKIHGLTSTFWTPGSRVKLFELISSFVPVNFNWSSFLVGYVLILLGTYFYSAPIVKKN